MAWPTTWIALYRIQQFIHTLSLVSNYQLTGFYHGAIRLELYCFRGSLHSDTHMRNPKIYHDPFLSDPYSQIRYCPRPIKRN